MLSKSFASKLIVAIFGCTLVASFSASAAVSSVLFGKTKDGTPVYLHQMTNASGMSVSISDLGATVVSIVTPDKNGKLDDVTLGYSTVRPYLTNSPYFGTSPGRYANRIAKAHFTLDGKTYQLAVNNGPNSLHGGKRGFDKYLYTSHVDSSDSEPAITYTRTSPDGEEGYPGNLTVTITFTLKSNNSLDIQYSATTDKPTVINLTNHCYFNLQGQTTKSVLNHVVQIKADKITPVDSTLIPTGKFMDVAGTPFDFRNPTAIGTHIHELTGKPVGFDHNFVLNKGDDWGTAAMVYEPTSGRTLTVKTNQPGMQFYTGNFLDGSVVGKHGMAYPQYSGFCMECQDFPDSPNQPNFPSAVLHPGDTYHNHIQYIFGVR